MSPRTTTRLVAALGLACALLTAACSDDFSPTEPNWAPDMAKLESPGGKSKTRDGGGTSTDAWAEDWGGEDEDDLIKSGLGWWKNSVDAVIGEAGGTLILFATDDEDEATPYHSLVVPPGAVSQPTFFMMELGSGPVIDVHLSANMVGSKTAVTTFDVPLTLTLSFEGSTAPEAGEFVIAHVVNGAVSEIVASSVDRVRRLVVGQISHFSRYAVAYE